MLGNYISIDRSFMPPLRLPCSPPRPFSDAQPAHPTLMPFRIVASNLQPLFNLTTPNQRPPPRTRSIFLPCSQCYTSEVTDEAPSSDNDDEIPQDCQLKTNFLYLPFRTWHFTTDNLSTQLTSVGACVRIRLANFLKTFSSLELKKIRNWNELKNK